MHELMGVLLALLDACNGVLQGAVVGACVCGGVPTCSTPLSQGALQVHCVRPALNYHNLVDEVMGVPLTLLVHSLASCPRACVDICGAQVSVVRTVMRSM